MKGSSVVPPIPAESYPSQNIVFFQIERWYVGVFTKLRMRGKDGDAPPLRPYHFVFPSYGPVSGRNTLALPLIEFWSEDRYLKHGGRKQMLSGGAI